MMLSLDPGIKPYSEAELTANRIQGGRTTNETALLQLAEIRRQQEAEAQVRAYYQQHPEDLVGGGGGPQSILGTLTPPGAGGPAGAITQQPFGPGGVTGPTQTIPAPMQPNANLGGPPGGPGQSTIATLGPQPQAQPSVQDRLTQMARVNPDAALRLQQGIQGQQDLALKRQEQQLKMRSTVAESIGMILQGVTDQASYDRAKQEIAAFSPQHAQGLPAVYSKEALIPYIKQAVSVKDNAQLQLETLKANTEIAKYNIQLANAGYQGLGEGVTSILRGLTPEQVEEFGGRTSHKAIAYATEEEKKRKLQQAGETERQRGETERALRGEKTVSEALGTKATNVFDVQTGQTLDARMKVKDYDALPAGSVKELSPKLTEQMENINNSVPVIGQLQMHIDKIYGPGGVLARMSPDERTMLTNAPSQWAKQYAQKYPELIQAQRFIDSNAGALARALAGEKGAMAEGDVERAKAMLPNLTTALKVWPPSELGWTQPDTRAVALRSMNSLVDLLNGRVRTLLGNEQFTHPKLHRYDIPDTDPDRPIPPLVGLNPKLPPSQPFGPGDPTQQLQPPVPTPAPTPPPVPPSGGPAVGPGDPTLQLRPPQGRQSQAQPSRRGIELARASGHKVMDMVDVEQAMADTGKSRAEVLAAAKAKGYTVYGSGASSALA